MTRMAKTLVLFWSIFALGLGVFPIRADSVLMRNGDRYNGKVLSVTTNDLVLQSEILGKVTLPRAKIANVVLGTNVLAKPALAKPKMASDIPAGIRQLGAHTNLIRRVQSQFLSAAGPEANDKFNQMLNELASGKLNMADLRAQAKSVADELRSLQREAGEDMSGTMKLYLSILDRFVKETEPTNNAATNPPASSLKPPTKPVQGNQ
jgi:hypothetical protein